jgi:phosphatidylserine decarboxylase
LCDLDQGMKTIVEWLAEPETKALKAKSDGGLYSLDFHRDPMRPIYLDPTVFYSPADGIVLYARESIGPDQRIVDIKGQKFTVRDILDDQDYDRDSMVVSVFMTKLDVHVNRIPTAGAMSEYHRSPWLYTPNVSMLLEEEDIINRKQPKTKDMDYMFRNERVVMRVYAPVISDFYFVVQVAEKDVDEIANWGNNSHFSQCSRYGIVRFGSQCDLIVPVDGPKRFELLAKENYHVKAGVDALIRIE